MFQYAIGRRLSIEHSIDFYIDSFLLTTRSKGVHNICREYALDIFNIKAKPAKLFQTLRYSPWGLPRPLRLIVKNIKLTNESRQTNEKKFGFDHSILQQEPPFYLNGLWQSQTYFNSIQQELRNDFNFTQDLDKTSVSMRNEMLNSNSVCLHVRRTDYLTESKDSPLGFIGLDYYRNGVSRIREEISNPRFFIFSDDLEWCKKELPFVPDATFVGNEHAGWKDSGHLHLMSLCKNFLIPNSTFSWWGAWLAKHPAKRVFLPNRWFRDPNMDASGYYCEGWERVAIS